MAVIEGSGVGGTFTDPNTTTTTVPTSSGGTTTPTSGGGSPSYPSFVPPDYASIIASSPYVIAAQAAAQAQLAALKGQLGSSAARALVNLGDMSLAGQVGDLALPDETGRLVEQGNTAGTSILSRLGYQHGLNQESIPASLAGRGFYRSGQTGYSLGQEEKQYGTQQYDARSSTLDYLNGLYSNYLNAQFGIQQQEMAAEFAAYQAALANAGAYVQPTGTTATQTQAPAPAPTSAYGYDANGNPVDFSSLWGDPSQGIYV